MSGTIRTIPNPPKQTTSKPSQVQSQVNEGIGNAIGMLTVGAFLVPIGLAGLAAVGMAKGISAVTRMGMRAYRKKQAQRAAQEAEITHRMEEYARRTEQFARDSEDEIRSISVGAGLPRTFPSDPALNRAADDFFAESEKLSGQIDRFTAQQSQAFDMLRDSVRSEIAANGASALSNPLSQQSRSVRTKWESQSKAAQEKLEASLREIHAKSGSNNDKSYDIGYGHNDGYSPFGAISITGGVIYTEGDHTQRDIRELFQRGYLIHQRCIYKHI